MVRIKKKAEIIISPQELLTVKPIRNPLVETKRYDSGELALILKLLPTKRRGLISRFFPMPRGRKIVLDEMGTHFWELCDGKNKVKDIISIFQKNYGMSPLEARMSISIFLESLSERRLVGFILPSDAKKRHEKVEGKFETLTVSDLPNIKKK